MNILVADKFEKSGIEGLKALGANVLYEPELKDDALTHRLTESKATILIVRSTKVTSPMIEASNLSVIIRAGAGYNTIDVAAASTRGILVSNCPGKNSQAVAELAFGLILACDRHIPDNVIDLRNGVWNKKKYSSSGGLYGRTLGLIGMGKISQEMIPRARAFGMNVVAYSRWMTSDIAAALGIGRAESAEDVARMSDVVSIHVSLNPDTKGLINEQFVDALKPGAIFVNTSRAEVVDQSALLAAVKSKGVIVGLDVFDGEPTSAEGTYEGELRNAENVYCTHHIGASTEQAQEAIAAETVRIVREYKLTGMVPNVVNLGKAEVATHLLVVRHLDKVGVLAHVLAVLKEEGASVQEMENIVLGGAKAAIAQITIDKEPSEESLHQMRLYPDIFDVTCFTLHK